MTKRFRTPTPRDADQGTYLPHRNTNKVVVSDERLIRREIYNPNKFPIKFTRCLTTAEGVNVVYYCRSCGIAPGAREITIQPKGFGLLQHQFYICEAVGATLSRGEPIPVVEKFGATIGDGDPNPSPPEVFKRFF